MSRVTVAWDTDATTVSTERYRATIRTGMTVLARNAFTVLAMTAPLAKAKLWDAMLAEARKLGSVLDSGALDVAGVPAFVLLDACGAHMAIGYGFVPSGACQRGQVHGEFRLVFMTEDEVPDSLTDIFGLESLWKEVEPCHTSAKRASAAGKDARNRATYSTADSMAATALPTIGSMPAARSPEPLCTY